MGRKQTVLGCLLLLACGCLGSRRGERLSDYPEFSRHLAAAAAAIHRSDLESAQAQVDALKQVDGPLDADVRIASMQALIDGAKAYRKGELDRARLAWRQIPDVALRSEVAARAGQFNLHIEPGP